MSTFRQLLFSYSIAALILTGCGEKPAPTIEDAAPAPYDTNAELVLEVLENKEGSGIVFHANPDGSTRCKYMHVEISREVNKGSWAKLKTSNPGKDQRETMGELDIENQLHFFAVQRPGTYAVTALGCQEYATGMVKLRGMLTTFTVEEGKLNYIGEIKLAHLPNGVLTTDVINRSAYAQEKLGTVAPGLNEYFVDAPMLNMNISVTDVAGAQLKAQAASLSEENALIEELNQVMDEIAVIDEKYSTLSSADKKTYGKRRRILLGQRNNIVSSINQIRSDRAYGLYQQ